jgi:hypothetical protein
MLTHFIFRSRIETGVRGVQAVTASVLVGKFRFFIFVMYHISSLISYFEKIEHAFQTTLLSVFMCVCVYPPIVARQRLGESPLIVARQRLGKNTPIVARQRLNKNTLIVARQRLGKNSLIVARQRLCRNVTAAMNTHAIIEELFDASFSMWPVSYQGK